MSIQIRRTKLFTKGLLVAASALMISGVQASGQESILHQAIHDYADDARGSFSEPGPGYLTGRYITQTVLDEAYHDYDGSDAKASNALVERATEDAEFAAFEQGPTFADIVPWELRQ
jgi:hypothetical protein